MSTTLVKIDVPKGLVKTVTAKGVENVQHYSIDDALAQVAAYMDQGYEVISSSGDAYVLKKPEGRKFITKGSVDERPDF